MSHTTSVPPTLPAHDWTAREEPLEKYRRTGYHPVKIGDVFNERYRVLRKLGWGVYSTVWLVQYERETHHTFAALKVLTDIHSEKGHELDYLQHIRKQSSLHPGSSFFLQLRDHFYHSGPNGKHLCLVTEPLTDHLHYFLGNFERCRMPVCLLKQITRQVLLALDYLHTECNLIHADIKPANIMMVPPTDADSFFWEASIRESTVSSAPANLDGGPDLRLPCSPVHYTLPSGDLNDSETWKATSVRLADVGVACWADKVSEHLTDMIQSPAMRAPEVCVGAGWGTPADIWSLGCTIYEIAMGKSLFPPDMSSHVVPALHTYIIGDYPEDLIKRGKYSKFYFNDDGALNINLPRRKSLKDTIQDDGGYPDADMFCDFLELMLALDPAKRASCRDLLAHEWLKI